MKRLLGFILPFSILIFAQPGFCDQLDEKWEDMSYGMDEADLQSVAISPQNPDMIYAASAKGIYKSSDTGKNWQKLSMIQGIEAAVNVISVDPKNMDAVYAGTKNGLYRSADGGSEWKRLYEGLSPEEKDVRRIVIDRADTNRIYLGTGKGLFLSRNAGLSWSRLSFGEISKLAINFIAQDPAAPDVVYVAAATGVFRSTNRGLSFERIFTVAAQTQEDSTDEDSQDAGDNEAESYSDKTSNCITFDSHSAKKIYIGTNSGVFASSDSGETWEQLPSDGLLNDKVMFLVSTKDGSLCAATRNGIFKLSRPYQQWDEIYNGILSKEARSLAYDMNKDFLWAATGKGLYQAALKPAPNPQDDLSVPDDVAKVLAKFKSEPTIGEVHEVAIRYADVHMGKIDKWRRDSKRKALVPTLSASVSPYLTNTLHWEGGSSSIPEDDILRRGATPADWAVSVSWDLSDLVWSTDLTTIDGRARYLVQLRDDVLSAVTRLYYERRRLQIEFITKPPKELNLKITKQLRIEELTANLDAYTGGWFSKKTRGGRQ